jgi:hypothetical protein
VILGSVTTSTDSEMMSDTGELKSALSSGRCFDLDMEESATMSDGLFIVDDKFTYEHYLKIILGNYRDDLRYID